MASGIRFSRYLAGRFLLVMTTTPPKGHHRHVGDDERIYQFTTLEALKNDFKADLENEMNRRGLV